MVNETFRNDLLVGPDASLATYLEKIIKKANESLSPDQQYPLDAFSQEIFGGSADFPLGAEFSEAEVRGIQGALINFFGITNFKSTKDKKTHENIVSSLSQYWILGMQLSEIQLPHSTIRDVGARASKIHNYIFGAYPDNAIHFFSKNVKQGQAVLTELTNARKMFHHIP